MEFLDNLPLFFRMMVTLILVIALMGGFAWVLRRSGLAGIENTIKQGDKRLKVVERMPLDTRRHLVLLSCDDEEHLVILSATGETILSKQTSKPSPAAKKGTKTS